MGTNHRRPQMLADMARAARDREAVADALATIEQFNARLAAGQPAWFWPTISAALVTKHHWLVIARDSCGTMIEMDLTVKRRDPDASIRVALRDVRCPRCNGNCGACRFCPKRRRASGYPFWSRMLVASLCGTAKRPLFN
jgi:hypothetical protein